MNSKERRIQASTSLTSCGPCTRSGQIFRATSHARNSLRLLVSEGAWFSVFIFVCVCVNVFMVCVSTWNCQRLLVSLWTWLNMCCCFLCVSVSLWCVFVIVCKYVFVNVCKHTCVCVLACACVCNIHLWIDWLLVPVRYVQLCLRGFSKLLLGDYYNQTLKS